MIRMENMMRNSPKMMSQMSPTQSENNTDPMMEHCKMMPEMAGCKKNIDHDMMSMSMNDMGKMLE